MTVIETLKSWADVEFNLLEQKPDLKNYSNSMIVGGFSLAHATYVLRLWILMMMNFNIS